MSYDIERLEKIVLNLNKRVLELEKQVFDPICEMAKDTTCYHSTHNGACKYCGQTFSCEHPVHEVLELPVRNTAIGAHHQMHCIRCHEHISDYWGGNMHIKFKILQQSVCDPCTDEDCSYCAELVAQKLLGEEK